MLGRAGGRRAVRRDRARGRRCLTCRGGGGSRDRSRRPLCRCLRTCDRSLGTRHGRSGGGRAGGSSCGGPRRCLRARRWLRTIDGARGRRRLSHRSCGGGRRRGGLGRRCRLLPATPAEERSAGRFGGGRGRLLRRALRFLLRGREELLRAHGGAGGALGPLRIVGRGAPAGDLPLAQIPQDALVVARVLGRVSALAAEGLLGREFFLAVIADALSSPGHLFPLTPDSFAYVVRRRVVPGAPAPPGGGMTTLTLGGRGSRVEPNRRDTQGKR